jgi:hypothetical protein
MEAHRDKSGVGCLGHELQALAHPFFGVGSHHFREEAALGLDGPWRSMEHSAPGNSCCFQKATHSCQQCRREFTDSSEKMEELQVK